MIDYTKFKEIWQLQSDYCEGWDKLNDSLIDTDKLDQIILCTVDKIINALWSAYFSEEGVDWINWWFYEKTLFPHPDENDAYDEEGKVIPTKTVKDMWELLKDYRI